MGKLFALAALAVVAAVVGLLAMAWGVVERVGEARVYADLTAWALLVTLLAFSVVGLAVFLRGLAQVLEAANAHKAAQRPERQTIVRERVIDGRPAAAPQLLMLDRPTDVRQLYPDAARAAIEAQMHRAQIAEPAPRPAEPADAWAEVEALFAD